MPLLHIAHFAILLWLGCLPGGDAANWAQVNGYNRQNTAQSKRSPFSRRWGFAVATIEKYTPPGVEVPDYEKSMMYILGGEDYKHATSGKATLDSQKNYYMYDHLWATAESGQFRNDVWRSTGAKFSVAADYLPKDPRAVPQPRFVSQTSWEQRGPDMLLPPVTSPPTDYREWLCCLSAAGIPCRDVSRCNDPAYRPTAINRRWSPRRNHRAVTVQTDAGDTIVVMGGRARELQALPWTYRQGGLINASPQGTVALLSEPVPSNFTNNRLGWKAASSVENILAHERAVLTSDVWASTDGEAWTLRNGGCYVLQQEHTVYPAKAEHQCASDADCYTKRFGQTRCVNNVCVCRYWSPRERFAIAATGRSIMLAGGITYVQKSLCGKFMCGGEHPKLLNDVWTSSDAGRTWRLLTAKADWAPRSDFAMVFMPVLNAYWIMGGMGAEDSDPQKNFAYSDLWFSNLGRVWTLNSSTNPWQPRFGHFVAVEGNRLYLAGGSKLTPIPPKPRMPDAATQADLAASHAITNIYRPRREPAPAVLPGEPFLGARLEVVEDVWTFIVGDTNASEANSGYYRIGGNVDVVPRYTTNDSRKLPQQQWLPDFGPWTDAAKFVDAASSISVLNLPAEINARIRKANVTSIEELSSLSSKQIELYNIGCGPVVLARAMVERCALEKHTFDGQSMRDVVLKDASYRERPSKAVPHEAPPCSQGAPVPTAQLDIICRQRWPSRTFMGGTIMDGALYILGGWEAVDNWADDVWYRDERKPSTFIDVAPIDYSDESFFHFICDEPYCTYEYRAVDVATGGILRDWTRCVAWLDTYGLNEFNRATQLEVRAYDPAGNRDDVLDLGRNVYIWTYKPKFPWIALILGLVFFVLLMIALLEAYRRYRRWLALQAYLAAKRKRKLKHRAAGTLKAYEEELLRQFEQVPEVVEAPKPVKELPQFIFGQKVEDNPTARLVAPLPVPLPVQVPLDRDGVEAQVGARYHVAGQPNEQDVRSTAIRSTSSQQPLSSRGKAGTQSQKLVPGKPAIVSLATGKIIDPNARASETDMLLPGMQLLRSHRETTYDPTIQLADHSRVQASELRLSLQSLQQPKKVTAFDALKAEVAKLAAVSEEGTPRMPGRSMPPPGRQSAASVFRPPPGAPTAAISSRFQLAPQQIGDAGALTGGAGRTSGRVARLPPVQRPQ